MIESVAVMAVTLLSAPPAQAVPELEAGSPEQRRSTLARILALKLRLGYELVAEAEFSAVVCTPSPRRWLWMRRGRENQRLNIAVDESGSVHLTKATQTAHSRPA
jgi:hypothetical protein